MKKILSSLPIIAMAGLAFFTGCKKADDVTPTSGKPSVTVTFDKANYGVQKDFKVSATVSTKGDSAFITIIADGNSTGNDMGAIYMMYQKDNEKSTKFTKFPNGTSIPGAGYTGTHADGSTPVKFNFAGSDYTFNVPNTHKASLKLTIPILLRTDANAMSDVFTIWITKNGKAGRFDNPTQALAYGIATVTLNYTNELLINYYETELGSSRNTTLGSLFSTKTGSSYSRKFAQDTLETGSTKYTDIVFNNITDGKFSFGSFYSSATATNADILDGFSATGITNITNITQIAESSTDFSTVTGDATLGAAVDAVINSTTPSFKSYTSDPKDKVLAFKTAAGKKGLIKIVSINNADGTSTSASLEVKVQR
jgi:hypothetical protein